ncbi:MAG: 8-oxo-dGTP diphosphatase [Lachnospiraceae bacterium]|nr:8-oxo-dGTP diphosphatase [Lachnospiraceae bacterium]
MNDSKILTTLCYIEQDDKYLMLHRTSKQNDINQGKWIGVGGHFKEGETPEECLLREVKEETGLVLTSYRLRGIITFLLDDWGFEYMFVYTADGFDGTVDERAIKACTEGTLQWIPKAQIPELNLWEGDMLFLKLLLENKGMFSMKMEYHGDKLTNVVTKVYE